MTTGLTMKPCTTACVEGYMPYLLALAVLGADQLSKAWIAQVIPYGHSRVIIRGFFSLTYVRNTGAAFSMLPFYNWLFISVGAAALAAVVIYRRRIAVQSSLVRFGIGIILGGILGNQIDRIRLGGVNDFLDFHHWPIFNLADTALFCGVGIVLLGLFRTDKMQAGEG